MRLVAAAGHLWSGPRMLAVVLIAVLVACVMLAGLTAGTVFSALRPASTWLIGPIVAALLTFLVILELCAASVMTLLSALLCLSYDIGRHRIGALLSLLTLVVVAAALRELWLDAMAISGVILPCSVALALTAIALWFDRTYRRPAYPGFRDFRRDVVDARQHLSRAAHGG